MINGAEMVGGRSTEGSGPLITFPCAPQSLPRGMQVAPDSEDDGFEAVVRSEAIVLGITGQTA